MSLSIDSRYITGIYAFGQWFKVKPNTVGVDAYEFVDWWSADLEQDEYSDRATVYQMGSLYEQQEPMGSIGGDFGPNSRKDWAKPTGSKGIGFIDADTGEHVSFCLMEVRAFKEKRPTREQAVLPRQTARRRRAA